MARKKRKVNKESPRYRRVYGRPRVEELLGKKPSAFSGDHILNDKMFYDLEIDQGLSPKHPVVAMYFAGNEYCCDPRRLSLPKHKPKYSMYDALKMRVEFLDGIEYKMSMGFAFVGSNPVYEEKLMRLFYYIRKPFLSMYTDGSDVMRYEWVKRFRDVNFILKNSSEVDYLPTYYEYMVDKMDKVSSIENKRLIARYNKDTKDEVLNTAKVLQEIRNDWEIVEFACGR